MTYKNPNKWLLLIHNIPPKPDALRVKIWRRLQQVGSVAIKQSVYVLPLSEQSREDFNWILKEITEGGGEGSIFEALFLEGLSDEQIIALFEDARKSDCEKIIEDAGEVLSNWSSKESKQQYQTKYLPDLNKLQRRLDQVTSIDFFDVPERGAAQKLLNELKDKIYERQTETKDKKKETGNLNGKTWVTRENIFIDRIASGWLIQRFVDKEAKFKYVRGSQYSPKKNDIRFDMFEGEFTHEGNLCTFEVMRNRLQLKDKALVHIAEIVHDIDLKDNKYNHNETDGFNALLIGLVASYPDDSKRMEQGLMLFDNFYSYFRSRK
ncbi:MAG: chromate resistance protein [Candidatus Marinimicrobia bacterium]|nr:chromate resistance protein [Candidatus Neomarinimicrobiota bacterium]